MFARHRAGLTPRAACARRTRCVRARSPRAPRRARPAARCARGTRRSSASRAARAPSRRRAARADGSRTRPRAGRARGDGRASAVRTPRCARAGALADLGRDRGEQGEHAADGFGGLRGGGHGGPRGRSGVREVRVPLLEAQGPRVADEKAESGPFSVALAPPPMESDEGRAHGGEDVRARARAPRALGARQGATSARNPSQNVRTRSTAARSPGSDGAGPIHCARTVSRPRSVTCAST